MRMILSIKTLLKGLILPPAGPILLAVLGLFLIRRRPLLARTCLVLGLGSLWLLSTPVVSDALERLAEHYPPLDLRSTSGVQAIVILGGGGYDPRQRVADGDVWAMSSAKRACRFW